MAMRPRAEDANNYKIDDLTTQFGGRFDASLIVIRHKRSAYGCRNRRELATRIVTVQISIAFISISIVSDLLGGHGNAECDHHHAERVAIITRSRHERMRAKHGRGKIELGSALYLFEYSDQQGRVALLQEELRSVPRETRVSEDFPRLVPRGGRVFFLQPDRDRSPAR